MRSSKTRLLSALTWSMRARRAVMSDPTVKQSRAMAQTLHALDFPPLNFQQLNVIDAPSWTTRTECPTAGPLLLRPRRNHAVAPRVRDRLPQMLVLIFENVHQRVLLRPVSSEQFHRRLQVFVGKSRNRFLQIDVRSFQSFLQFLRIGDRRGLRLGIRCVRKHAGK